MLRGYAEKLLRLSDEASSALAGSAPAGRAAPRRAREHDREPPARGARRVPRGLSRGADRAHDRHQRRADRGGARSPRSMPPSSPSPPRRPSCRTCRSSPSGSSSSPRAATARCAAPKDVAGRSVIAFPNGCAYRRRLYRWLGETSTATTRVLDLGSYHAIVACVGSGTGIALMPESVLDTLPLAQVERHRLPRGARQRRHAADLAHRGSVARAGRLARAAGASSSGRVAAPGSRVLTASRPSGPRLHSPFIAGSPAARRLASPATLPLPMSHLIVHGGRPLRGRVSPSANKNAVLPVLCATLLTGEPVDAAPRARHHRRAEAARLFPRARLLGRHGLRQRHAAPAAQRRHPRPGRAPARRHALLGHAGAGAAAPLRPGAAGRRRHRLHPRRPRDRSAHRRLPRVRRRGASCERGATAIEADAPARGERPLARLRLGDHDRELRPLRRRWPRGRSRLVNAACEPHVQEFCAFLGRMGARIAGSGSSRLEVEGVERWAAPNTPSRTTSTRSRPSSR